MESEEIVYAIDSLNAEDSSYMQKDFPFIHIPGQVWETAAIVFSVVLLVVLVVNAIIFMLYAVSTIMMYYNGWHYDGEEHCFTVDGLFRACLHSPTKRYEPLV